MIVVKPPSFDELVRKYGSRQAAVQHLLDFGFKPEEIDDLDKVKKLYDLQYEKYPVQTL